MSRDQISVPAKSKDFRMPTPVISHTREPSVTGDGEDMFCLRSMWLPPPIGVFHGMVGLVRSIAQSSSDPERESVATLRKIRSPQMIGVDPLYAGSGSFQATFWVALHVVGRPVSADTPFSVGPRQFGQLSAAKMVVVAAIKAHVTQNSFRIPSPLGRSLGRILSQGQ